MKRAAASICPIRCIVSAPVVDESAKKARIASINVHDVMISFPSKKMGFVYCVVTQFKENDKKPGASFFAGHDLYAHTKMFPRSSDPISPFRSSESSTWVFSSSATYNLKHYMRIAAVNRTVGFFDYVTQEGADDGDYAAVVTALLQLCDPQVEKACLRAGESLQAILSSDPRRHRICNSTQEAMWYAQRVALPIEHFNLALHWHTWRHGGDTSVTAGWTDIQQYARGIFPSTIAAEQRYQQIDRATDELGDVLMHAVLCEMTKGLASECIDEYADEGITEHDIFGDD